MIDHMTAGFHVVGCWATRKRVEAKCELIAEYFTDDYARRYTEAEVIARARRETFDKNLVMITTTGIRWTVLRPRKEGGADEIPLAEAGTIRLRDRTICSIAGDCIPQLLEEPR
ncbi:hypothetical protein [Lentzea guizhouensis]|nr:hypothetical protein [Lentzea guizhouensis]